MKKVFKTFLVIAVTAVAGYNVYQSNYSVMNNLSEFALANVEALADAENNFDFPTGLPFTIQCGVNIDLYTACTATVVECKGGGTGCNERRCPTHGN